jgi:hypothetical protein
VSTAKTRLNLAGQRFGRLLVLKFAGLNRHGSSLWTCICDCGRSTAAIVGSDLRRGMHKSCGCLRRETLPTYKHGACRSGGTPEYRAWRGLCDRCVNPKSQGYRNYGGRGITVCPRWLGENGFETFLADMGRRPNPEHSIDRIDNDKGYSPENCRWATRSEQRRNQRPLKGRRMLILQGRSQSVARWAREIGIGASTILFRLRKGWSVAETLTEPLQQQQRLVPCIILSPCRQIPVLAHTGWSFAP